MGCTSSAPNTIPPNASTADKSIQLEETNENPLIEVDVADIEDENRTNQTKVLPSCDTFEETVQLVRNNKSSANIAIEKGANGLVVDSNNVIKIPANPQDEVKIPKLELFMDKVFESNHHLSESDQKHESEIPLDSKNEVEITGDINEVSDAATEPECNDKPETEENTEDGEKDPEEKSPSQSQSSHATRWEALADIAAELPPSLAVDPVTGQIYQIAIPKHKSDQ